MPTKDLRINPEEPVKRSNLDIAYTFLTTEAVAKASEGRIKPLSPDQAAALIGSWQVETGSQDLSNLDVVERGNGGKGRGLSQYTATRRTAYDKARQGYLQQGGDPNNIDFQLKYFAEEYAGKHDPAPGKSLSGWTRSFERIPADRVGATTYLTDNYFRPSTPHLDRRIKNANDFKAPLPVSNESPVNQTPTPEQPMPNRTQLAVPKKEKGNGMEKLMINMGSFLKKFSF